MNSRKLFIVSDRFTVVPQIARISAGSSDGASGAEKLRAEDVGRARFVPSLLRSSAPCVRRARRAVGVRLREE
jgi:hypothetical protein